MGRGGRGSGGRSAQPQRSALELALETEELTLLNEPKEHAVILDKDGNVLARVTQNRKKSVTFTAEEVALMNDAILTHNHPVPVSFSYKDLEAARASNAQAVRVVYKDLQGRTVIAQMARPEKGWMNQRSIEFAYKMADRSVWAGLNARVRNKLISIDEANDLGSREVMRKFAQYGAGIYTETVLP